MCGNQSLVLYTSSEQLAKRCAEIVVNKVKFISHFLHILINRNLLASFRGNRFNILFYDAGAVYNISDVVVSFFKTVG